MPGTLLSEGSTVVCKKDEVNMTEIVRNSRNKKVAEVDKQTKTVVIKQSDCRTTIHFADDGTLEIENTMKQNI